MAEYLLWLVTIPALAAAWAVVVVIATRTNTIALSCGCGKDWGSPEERGWRWWWQPVVTFAHDRLSRQHRAWRDVTTPPTQPGDTP